MGNEKHRKFDELINLIKNDVKEHPELFHMKHEGDKTIALAFNCPNLDWENGMILISKDKKYLSYSSKKLLGLVDIQDDTAMFNETFETFNDLYSDGFADAYFGIKQEGGE